MLCPILGRTVFTPALLSLLLLLPLTLSCTERDSGRERQDSSTEVYDLPSPALESDYSIEEALQSRRSVRRFRDETVSIETVSQILWSAQGITHEGRGFRTAPSAGATFPLEIYIASGNVEGLPAGLYRYLPAEHQLIQLSAGDLRTDLSNAALRQTSVRDGAFVVIIAAIYERTTGRYGDRGIKYTHMEVGHVGQNIHLQAESLGLGTVVIGAFRDDEVKEVLGLPENEVPLYLMPLGKK